MVGSAVVTAHCTLYAVHWLSALWSLLFTDKFLRLGNRDVRECVSCGHLVCVDCLTTYVAAAPDNAELCPSCRFQAASGDTYYQEPHGLLLQMLSCLGRVAALEMEE